MAEIQTNPKAFAKALKGSIKSAMPSTLTAMARTSKKVAPQQIARDMTLRSKGFIKSSIRYTGARSSRLQSEYGMIPRDRFTGLVAQEKGQTDNSKRAATLGSRGGNLRRRVSPRMRLKESTKVAKAKDFKRKPKSDIEMLAVWRKVGYKGLFMLVGSQGIGIRDGIYRFVGGKKAKLRLVHALGDIPQQRKRPWMDHTNQRLIRANFGEKKWTKTMTQFLKDRTRRLTK
jgi:hypothetical protein